MGTPAAKDVSTSVTSVTTCDRAVGSASATAPVEVGRDGTQASPALRLKAAVGDCCGLNQLGIGCQGCVVSVGGDDPDLRRRLLEMGFCNGVRVEVVRRAPLGDPIEFRLRGYCLSLRDEQAKYVQIAVR